LPELRPGQVVTWLPDGRWVIDPDESEADTGDQRGGGYEAPGGRRRRLAGDQERGEPEHGRRHSGRGGPESGRRHSGRGGPESGRRHSGLVGPESGQGRSGRGGMEPGQRRSGRGEHESAQRRQEPAELARRWGRRRVRLARIGARLAGWPRRVVIGVLLVVAAVLAVRPDGAQAPAAAVGATEHVVVAARDLAAGTELAAADLRIVSMPVGIVPSGSSPRAAGLIGRIAAAAIRRGEALTDARVVGPGLTAGLGPGESAAVPVRIADPDAAALVRVGDRVDVLGTPVAPDGTQATASETVTVASAVRVLAVLRSRDPADGIVLVLATGEAAARTLAGAAVRHRLTVNVRPP
jgi:Flp pilus assembly protein CpaB